MAKQSLDNVLAYLSALVNKTTTNLVENESDIPTDNRLIFVQYAKADYAATKINQTIKDIIK